MGGPPLWLECLLVWEQVAMKVGMGWEGREGGSEGRPEWGFLPWVMGCVVAQAEYCLWCRGGGQIWVSGQSNS